MCQFCAPLCDKCRPKFMDCPQCGKRMFIQADFCPTCKHVVTAEDREQGRAAWRARHPHVEIGQGKNQAGLTGGNSPAALGEGDWR